MLHRITRWLDHKEHQRKEARRKVFMDTIPREAGRRYFNLENKTGRAHAIERKTIITLHLLTAMKRHFPLTTVENLAKTLIDIEDRRKQLERRGKRWNRDPHLKELTQKFNSIVGQRTNLQDFMQLITEMESAMANKIHKPRGF